MDGLADEIRRTAQIAEGVHDHRAYDRPAEPWDDARVADRIMLRLLEQTREHGPLTADQFARHCLRPDELATVLPEKERLDNAKRTIEALIAYLSPPERAKAYDAAVQHWIQSLERVRWMMQWTMLPPRIEKHVRRRADHLCDSALEQGWIKRVDEDDDRLELTLTGHAAIETLQQRATQPDPQ